MVHDVQRERDVHHGGTAVAEIHPAGLTCDSETGQEHTCQDHDHDADRVGPATAHASEQKGKYERRYEN
jgi:hypothetical protein